VPRPEKLETISKTHLLSCRSHLRVVNALHIVTAHRLRLAANREDGRVRLGGDGRAVVVIAIRGRGTAGVNQRKTAARHDVGELCVVVHSVVVRFDAVRVVNGEFWIFMSAQAQFYCLRRCIILEK
jgi:hypothetical protein